MRRSEPSACPYGAPAASYVPAFSFGFVEFENPRHAEDAIKKLDGYYFGGSRLLVEASRSNRGVSTNVGGMYGRRENRVIIDSLGPHTTWQDLKDFGREAGSVAYADVYMEHGRLRGVIEYSTRDGARTAVRKLHGVRLQGAYVSVREEGAEDYNRRSRSRSRSPIGRRGVGSRGMGVGPSNGGVNYGRGNGSDYHGRWRPGEGSDVGLSYPQQGRYNWQSGSRRRGRSPTPREDKMYAAHLGNGRERSRSPIYRGIRQSGSRSESPRFRR
ncbi:hypothetical protein CBR_g40433 [Chara braunii]|uniref:RRM domain-containing protein n=1 Tax=Chara braunii TaxID=69332 RepID=A0A388LTQ4_CHABU|nr:hypothetical protein CBR_g40433 [Chara braunii]|eukprot:GBG85704.1 hypothetical protein CBR_g40433 [Chara braunii]